MTTPLNQPTNSNSKEEKIASFDPNGVGDVNGGLFGLPFTVEEAEVVIVPVPWEVTVSYSAGTAQGPLAVKEASPQLDLFEPAIKDAWKLGIAMEEISADWEATSAALRDKAEAYINWLEDGSPASEQEAYAQLPVEVTRKGEELLQWLKAKALSYLDQGKLVGVLGGDHSTPLGLMHALAERHEEYGILQVDAHADLRDAYEGFEFSHASIMFNALKLPQVKKLVQVGIRDICQAEAELAEQSNGRVAIFYDAVLKENMYEGDSWKKECKKIIAQLPQKVYVSFDIDGLDPKLCPATGTPVPGGLEFEQAVYLIKALVKSGREIIGFDLCEVAPGDSEWNGNVGARLLYKLCNWMAVSQKRLEL
ncbi:agmatinase family protein [Pontibacter qinzhouensis]|uniref:Agmatinase family protein n=1 Tax=Pontibacter qinzhouensis TaxID=2603253 RepID=A0A5C8J162_9BACT|nr:agmatinase family protein [Pontibacter qinzhouensis]TXK27115.1 agmatinase family protein [Pontibacter qinzhouensis]